MYRAQNVIPRANIEHGDLLDVVMAVESIDVVDETVAYYAWGRDDNGRRIVLTVFDDQRPEIELVEGESYQIDGAKVEDPEEVRNGRLGAADYALVLHSTTEVRSADPDRSEVVVERAPEIDDGEKLTIDLSVSEVEQPEGHDEVHQWAWCRDTKDRTVIVTVFENNRPETPLEVGKQYRLRSVVGKAWDDGTPGVYLNRTSTVQLLSEPAATAVEESSEPVEQQTELMIDAIERDEPTYEPSDSDVFGPVFGRLPAVFRGRLSIVVAGAIPATALAASLASLDLQLPIVLVLTLTVGSLAAAHHYGTRYVPTRRFMVREKRKHVQAFLEMLQQDYFDAVDATAPVRVNVMTLDGLSSQEGLSIYSYSGDYSGQETKVAYEPPYDGPWGKAYGECERVVHDRVDVDSPGFRFTEDQETVQSFRSSMSVPIYSGQGPNRVAIGVLTIDSEAGIGETQFDDPEVRKLLTRYRRLVGDVLE